VVAAEVIIFSPVAIILGFCSTFFSYYYIITVVFLVWQCLFILANGIWSLFQIIIVFQLLTTMSKDEHTVVVFKKKNIQFLLCSIATILCCVILIVTIILDFLDEIDLWSSLIINFIFRIVEIFDCYLFFIIVEGFTISRWCGSKSGSQRNTI